MILAILQHVSFQGFLGLFRDLNLASASLSRRSLAKRARLGPNGGAVLN
jgi:hypothetical protein